MPGMRNPLLCVPVIIIQHIIQFLLVVQVAADDYCNENVVLTTAIVVAIPSVLWKQDPNQAVSDRISDTSECRSPLKCCSDGSNSCCVQDDDDEDLQHYGYRISIWNMWYFWFVILFILMSCFGGCGYYKQRQRVLQARGLTRTSFFVGRSRQSGATGRPEGVGIARDPQSYYAYSNPSVEIAQDSSLYPPAYSEVVSHPGFYPYRKSNLPPYPLETVLPGRATPETAGMMPLPPPYSEVVSNTTSSNHSTDIPAAQAPSQVDITHNAASGDSCQH